MVLTSGGFPTIVRLFTSQKIEVRVKGSAMAIGRWIHGVLLAAGIAVLAPGCFSLSLGTRNCTGQSPEVKARLDALENRVGALEQMIGTPTGEPSSVMMPTEVISQPGMP